MWPRAKCENRGRRTRLQRRLGRLRRSFGSGSFGSQTVPVWIVFIARARRSGYLLTHQAWVADPGRGAERLSERLPERFSRRGPDAEKRIRSRVLRDVARRPSVETGATVPGYSGGVAAFP